jgi:putative ABC transport system permease protein
MSIFEDVRFGWRTLARSPGFTAIAIKALALGIGVNAFIFSLANGVLFKNLPFAHSDRILYLAARNPAARGSRNFSYPEYLDLKAQVKSFEALGVSTSVSARISDRTASPEGYLGDGRIRSGGPFMDIGGIDGSISRKYVLENNR